MAVKRTDSVNIRAILTLTLVALGVFLSVGTGNLSAAQAKEDRPVGEEYKVNLAVSPVEDLMREHGVLNRLLLIYEEILRRMDANETYPTYALVQSTGIIRNFMQDYHEKLEERYIFPRFRKANKLVELVKVLEQQHEAGRKIIDDILARANSRYLRSRSRLAGSMRMFIRMYRPHMAREDTVLFPALQLIVSPKEYNDLGEEFEKEEERLFGEKGFEKIVLQVERIEKELKVYELSQFTPKYRGVSFRKGNRLKVN